MRLAPEARDLVNVAAARVDDAGHAPALGVSDGGVAGRESVVADDRIERAGVPPDALHVPLDPPAGPAAGARVGKAPQRVRHVDLRPQPARALGKDGALVTEAGQRAPELAHGALPPPHFPQKG